MRLILLNPGPVTLSQRVRNALLRDDLCHREPEFAALQSGIRKKLLQVYSLDGTAWAAALMTGSGTAAVEAMVSTLVPTDGKLLSVENGVYGERITKIAEHYQIPLAVAHFDWTDPIDVEQIDRQLSEDPTVTHLAVVHHETTTGRLNALAALGTVCKRHGVQILLDAVSSFGAEKIDFDNLPIAGCAATANKCLHAVPGTCFVICARQALHTAAPRNLYLNVVAYVDAQDNNGTPFTQSIQTFYALDEALDELEELGGMNARRDTYVQRMATVRTHLKGLGVEALLDDEACSSVLNAYRLPVGRDYATLHDNLKAAGFVIYAGQGAFASSIFRISMMGDIGDTDVVRLNQALSEALAD